MAAGITLLASGVRTASGTAVVGGEGATSNTATLDISRLHGLVVQLNVSAAATVVGDTLNVYLQHSVDGAVTFDDFVSFTQVLGNGGTKLLIAQWERDVTPTTPLHAQSDGTLAAGVLQGPVGDDLRLKWTIAGASPSFTFSVLARTLRNR